jgi:hypothetical protein
VIDIKRIIEQPYTTTELTTIIGQVMVFVLSLPYVGTPSVPVQQLQSWVKQQWDTVPADRKKNGRRLSPTHVATAEVENWFLDSTKATYLSGVTTNSFTETHAAADHTMWCNVHTATVPCTQVSSGRVHFGTTLVIASTIFHSYASFLLAFQAPTLAPPSYYQEGYQAQQMSTSQVRRTSRIRE